MPGVSELLVIFMILVVVFGASRLPALGEGLGRAVRSFKRGGAQDESIAVKGVAPEVQASAAEGGAEAEGGADAQDAQDAEVTPSKPS